MSSAAAPSAERQVDAALAALRKGRQIVLSNGELSVAFLSAELADDAAIASFLGDTAPRVLLSTERAARLGLVDPADTGASFVVELDSITIDEALALANPLVDQYTPVKPARQRTPTVPQIADAAIRLAKMAEVLPALIYRYAREDEAVDLPVELLETYSPERGLALSVSTNLPVHEDEKAKAFIFREALSDRNHLALWLGKEKGDATPLVRLHSECLTGDALSSLKCDCGPQLTAAKQAIAADGGYLVYLRQEGRGIGLVNKMRAYSMQARGLDTVDANLHVGFGDDERDYRIAAEMLRQLGVSEVRLLTNNPEKIRALEAEGIAVVERIPLELPSNPHNAKYLATKRDKAGHMLK
ncbi:GTP cyclohydrolase II [Aurantiacibacter sp. D1-12]|uniref:GTP cyclohydrolase II n=1 Tax=Aurantiacibacter sp. D1-12 TaxID=2993658 RepID=UPI00237D0E59|nr:GTP cyclohydrolase II [Aurantiacibacter sp. D1-12]MDE1467409.1 GTP cyclohydrolase II [Aurantiacibacter sp. D1-12]